jgi:hypothetical protein
MAALAGAVMASCTTDAVGIEVCRKIETARCEAARQCGYDDAKVESCTLFYRDQCLHGVENIEDTPTESQANVCADAVNVVAGCAQKKVASMEDCPMQLVTGASGANIKPCDVILDKVHLLAACSFVTKEDAGTSTEADAGNDDAADATGD